MPGLFPPLAFDLPPISRIIVEPNLEFFHEQLHRLACSPESVPELVLTTACELVAALVPHCCPGMSGLQDWALAIDEGTRDGNWDQRHDLWVSAAEILAYLHRVSGKGESKLPLLYLENVSARLSPHVPQRPHNEKQWVAIPFKTPTCDFKLRETAALLSFLRRPIVDASLLCYPLYPWQEGSLMLELLVDSKPGLQPILFRCNGGSGSECTFDSMTWYYRGAEYKVMAYEGLHQLTNQNPDYDVWGPLLLKLSGSAEYGYLIGNQIEDIAFVQGVDDGDWQNGYRLRFDRGPDIWSTNCADFNWISLGGPPEADWMRPFSGVWMSEIVKTNPQLRTLSE